MPPAIPRVSHAFQLLQVDRGAPDLRQGGQQRRLRLLLLQARRQLGRQQEPLQELTVRAARRIETAVKSTAHSSSPLPGNTVNHSRMLCCTGT